MTALLHDANRIASELNATVKKVPELCHAELSISCEQQPRRPTRAGEFTAGPLTVLSVPGKSGPPFGGHSCASVFGTMARMFPTAATKPRESTCVGIVVNENARRLSKSGDAGNPLRNGIAPVA